MSDLKPPILNPDTYLNYLSPDAGVQYEAFRNVHIFALGVYICDILSTVPQEVKMMRNTRFTPSICAYWITRVFAFTDLTLIVFSATGPVDHCQSIMLGIDASYIITGAAASFLFLRRVQAVFFSNKVVHWCFSALWLATIVAWVLAPIGAGYGEIADTKHCIPTHAPRFLVAGCIVPLVYDSLTFLAISYKVVTSYSSPEYPSTRRTFFSRPLSHPLPRSILHGGQQYYFVSVCANVLAALLLLIPAVPVLYRAIIINPAMVLTSSMACRVFRNLFLQDFEIEGRSKRTRAMELTSVLCQTEVVSGEAVPSEQVPDQDNAHVIV